MWDSRSSHWPGDPGRHRGLGWPSSRDLRARTPPQPGPRPPRPAGLQSAEPELDHRAELFSRQTLCRGHASATQGAHLLPAWLRPLWPAPAPGSCYRRLASRNAPSVAACRGRHPGVRAAGTHLRCVRTASLCERCFQGTWGTESGWDAGRGAALNPGCRGGLGPAPQFPAPSLAQPPGRQH